MPGPLETAFQEQYNAVARDAAPGRVQLRAFPFGQYLRAYSRAMRDSQNVRSVMI